jgi:hypothetical protein
MSIYKKMKQKQQEQFFENVNKTVRAGYDLTSMTSSQGDLYAELVDPKTGSEVLIDSFGNSFKPGEY